MQSRSGTSLCDNYPRVNGNVHLEIFKNGCPVKICDDKNLIVEMGRVNMAHLLGGESGRHAASVGAGSSDTPASPADTELTDQSLVPINSVEYPDNRTVRFNFIFGTDDAVGLGIREFGLFCANGEMFSRRARTGVIEKADDMEIHGYWEIHF